MQTYFTLAKKRKPDFEIAPFAKEVLNKYYLLRRCHNDRDKSRTTIRLLESLIRLAQAHARLMYRDVIVCLDSIQAVLLMEKSYETSGQIQNYAVLQTEFSDSAFEEYQRDRSDILRRLFPDRWKKGEFCDMDPSFDYKKDIRDREMKEISEMSSDNFLWEPSQPQNTSPIAETTSHEPMDMDIANESTTKTNSFELDQVDFTELLSRNGPVAGDNSTQKKSKPTRKQFY